jgi:hypothetical protein
MKTSPELLEYGRINNGLNFHLRVAVTSMLLVLLSLLIPAQVYTIPQLSRIEYGHPFPFIQTDASGIRGENYGEIRLNFPQEMPLFTRPSFHYYPMQFKLWTFILSGAVVFVILEFGFLALRLTRRRS